MYMRRTLQVYAQSEQEAQRDLESLSTVTCSIDENESSGMYTKELTGTTRSQRSLKGRMVFM